MQHIHQSKWLAKVSAILHAGGTDQLLVQFLLLSTINSPPPAMSLLAEVGVLPFFGMCIVPHAAAGTAASDSTFNVMCCECSFLQECTSHTARHTHCLIWIRQATEPPVLHMDHPFRSTSGFVTACRPHITNQAQIHKEQCSVANGFRHPET